MDRVAAIVLAFVPTILLASVCAYLAITAHPLWVLGVVSSMVVAPSVTLK